jgi:hypothetical protein
MDKTERLLVLSIVPEPYSRRVDNIRKLLCNEANSYASLQFPPHFTAAHLRIPKGTLDSCLKEIELIAECLRDCEVKVTGISYHNYTERKHGEDKPKYTIRLAVEPNLQLSEVHGRLKAVTGNSNRSALGSSSHHITLLFGDLAEKEYQKLKEDYIPKHGELDQRFTYICDNLSVLSREGGRWQIIRSFKV